ncbi:hypothetical protein [Glaciibacter psychrotolerans]|uniref:Uncharacterized protein n=1 Tax=Glaciibacter psychrotolerans TaxID=670054 RepID=A0A7Z0EDS8_9MICO|nr:hypothetical protein [Leifsonia psychrotolerans]NYJ19811.1 hypothetical protein [Leifsonia psychrotolerans]
MCWELGIALTGAVVGSAPAGETQVVAVSCHVSGTLGNPVLEYTLKTH